MLGLQVQVWSLLRFPKDAVPFGALQMETLTTPANDNYLHPTPGAMQRCINFSDETESQAGTISSAATQKTEICEL